MITLEDVIAMKALIKKNREFMCTKDYIQWCIALMKQDPNNTLIAEANNIAAREFNKNFRRVEEQ